MPHAPYLACVFRILFCFFFFNDTATTEIYPLPLHAALPIAHPPRAAHPSRFDRRAPGPPPRHHQRAGAAGELLPQGPSPARSSRPPPPGPRPRHLHRAGAAEYPVPEGPSPVRSSRSPPPGGRSPRMSFRLEKDPLGEKQGPADALYGIQTLRAVENFPISGLRPLPAFVDAVIWIKKAAALTHRETGRLEARLADAIVRAADEILAGQHRDQFVVDVHQAGAGPSHNMNCNEVLANRANELLGAARGAYAPVHPNDHVNMAQSTNDVIPTAMRLATLATLPLLLDAMQGLAESLLARGRDFDGIVKAGRTHLQDATPIRLGQEFTAYGRTVARHRAKLAEAAEWLRPMNIGGTAVGTGLNADPEYPRLMVEQLRAITGMDLREAQDRIQLMQSMGDIATMSGALRAWTLDLNRIANDIRLLASGPRTALAEIQLPAVQPGSSIMPGKVNPSIAEMVNQVCFQVLGLDTTVALASEAGQLELT